MVEEKVSQKKQPTRPSYTMLEERVKKIYLQFYKETCQNSTIDRKTQELMAVAASLGFRCEGCLGGHLQKTLKHGATKEEISQAIGIALGVAAASVIDQTDIAPEQLQARHFE